MTGRSYTFEVAHALSRKFGSALLRNLHKINQRYFIYGRKKNYKISSIMSSVASKCLKMKFCENVVRMGGKRGDVMGVVLPNIPEFPLGKVLSGI